MMKRVLAGLLVTLILATAACGQKGDLYLPEPPAESQEDEEER